MHGASQERGPVYAVCTRCVWKEPGKKRGTSGEWTIEEE